jgi:hypothetical protein
MTTRMASASGSSTRAQPLDARRCAGLSGIAGAVLFGVGGALWAFEWPGAGAPAAKIVRFYHHASGRIIVGASLSLLAIAAFVLFAAAIRRVLTEAEGDDLLPTTAFGGALLAGAAGFAAETINMVGAARAQDGTLTYALAQSLWELARVFGSSAGGVGLGVFALATAAVALRTNLVLARPLAIVFALLGATLLTPASYYVGQLTGGALILFALIIAAALLRAPDQDRGRAFADLGLAPEGKAADRPS